MKKPILFAAAVAVLGVVLFLGLRDRGNELPPAAEPERIRQQTFDPTPAARGRALPSGRKAVVGEAEQPPVGPATEVEREAIMMYEEMANAFTENFNSCDRIGVAMAKAIETHRPAITRLVEERAELGPQGFALSQRRIEQQFGPRMAELRHGIEQAASKCKRNPQVMNALRGLAKIGTAG